MNHAVRRHIGRLAQQVCVAFMTFAPGRNFAKLQRGMLPEIIFDLLLGDAVPRHDLGVFDAEGSERRAAAEAADVEVAHAAVHADHFGERSQRLLAAAPGGVDRQKTVDAEYRHRALFRLKTELDVIRLPGAFLLILAEAHGVFSRPAEGGAVRFSREAAADGDENQAYGAADGRVGAKAGAENAG